MANRKSKRLSYMIEPQRSNGHGYEACEPHRATRFAIIEVKRWQKGKRHFEKRVVHSLHTTHDAAKAHHARMTRIAQPLPKPGLGQRFPTTGREIIARSLSLEQWMARGIGGTDKEA